MRFLLCVLLLGCLPTAAQDNDGDGVPDSIDVCPWWDPGNGDVDGDGLGDCVDYGCETVFGSAFNWGGPCDHLCEVVWPSGAIFCVPLTDEDDAGPGDAGAVTDAGVLDDGGVDGGAPDGGVFVDLLPTSPACDPSEFTHYPPGQVHSPITCGVAENIRAIIGPASAENLVKVGDSISYGSETMGCFVDEAPLELGSYAYLADSISAVGQMDRPSLAAQVGADAAWATTGSPSPIERELAANRGRFALLMYGANDVGSPGAQWIPLNADLYAGQMLDAANELIAGGAVPIFMTQPPLAGAGYPSWAPSLAKHYANLNRGLAEALQVPYVDIQATLLGLPNFGLVDGVHLNHPSDTRRCDFSANGMQFGGNVRHLFAMQSIDRVREIQIDGHWDAVGAPVIGNGSRGDPIVLDLPVAIVDTTLQPAAGAFTCATTSERARFFEVAVGSTTSVYAQVVSLNGSEHGIKIEGTSGGCLAAHGNFIERTLAPGTYRFVVEPRSAEGEFVLVVTEK